MAFCLEIPCIWYPYWRCADSFFWKCEKFQNFHLATLADNELSKLHWSKCGMGRNSGKRILNLVELCVFIDNLSFTRNLMITWPAYCWQDQPSYQSYHLQNSILIYWSCGRTPTANYCFQWCHKKRPKKMMKFGWLEAEIWEFYSARYFRQDTTLVVIIKYLGNWTNVKIALPFRWRLRNSWSSFFSQK